jgi:thioredoxin 1
MAGANVIEITESNFETEVLNSKQPVLVDFWAEWCQPCRMLGPRIEELANEYVGKAKIGKVDVEGAQALAMRFNIASIPTVLVFKDGQVKQTFIGVRNKKDYAAVLDSLAG